MNLGKWSLSLINKIVKMIQAVDLPSHKELRNFGIIMSIALSIFFFLVLPFFFAFNPQYKLLWAILLLILFSIFAPKKLLYFYKFWMIFGLMLNWVNTRLILGLVFFTLFLIIAIIFKLLKKDPMNRKIDKNILTYREIVIENSHDHMERPY
tara:strand:- start:378 stop:833 length:456 start_codon:yes stop_codon:yes gene_type:complete